MLPELSFLHLEGLYIAHIAGCTCTHMYR